ncbi:tyrosine-type recombinase/integrase [Pseudoxanthomonas winnipegensis]|uniref:tyrosine-type recombinase/integrase n=1 Tax=Pseudoxanthomonas winnipegensis TaxID=2480810 RepID=UPI0022A8B832|nr:tyrosine-type recombinase/integrase [Pseudoxanthomonas winnipegensis]
MSRRHDRGAPRSRRAAHGGTATARAAGADIPEDHPPTFHEIRSLGGALLRSEKGWTEKQVQALMGHSSEAMTRVYLDGHEVPWSEVSTGAVRIS